MNADQLNVRSGEVVDAAMRVHSALGPGLLESAYRLCLTNELQTRGLQVDSEVVMPLVYRGVRLDAAYRVDMLVDKELIVVGVALYTIQQMNQHLLLRKYDGLMKKGRVKFLGRQGATCGF